jgi:hypothetical protein
LPEFLATGIWNRERLMGAKESSDLHFAVQEDRLSQRKEAPKGQKKR